MSSVTVALDNLIVRAEEVDVDTVLAYGIELNNILERNKEAYVKAYTDLIVFGSCELPVHL